MRILVLHLPGLSARALHAHRDACPSLEAFAHAARFATLSPLATTSDQAARALWTGLLPGCEGREFWAKIAERAPVLTFDIRLPGHATDAPPPDPHLRVLEIPATEAVNALAAASDVLASAGDFDVTVLVSAWALDAAGQEARHDCDPMDRPVLVTRGLDQARPVIGVCEVAGLLERALTGERLRDAL